MMHSIPRPGNAPVIPDIEMGRRTGAGTQPPAPPTFEAPQSRRCLWLAGIGLLAAGAGVGAWQLAEHLSHKPTLTPTPAPTPARLPPPPPATVTPAVTANMTGTLGNQPLTIAPRTAMYVGQPSSSGLDFGVVITDATQTCATLTAGPLRGTGINELDLCTVMNGTQVLAQNGALISNGQQYASTAFGMQVQVDVNANLHGSFAMNTSDNGFISGAFVAQPCATMEFTHICQLQN